MATEEQRFDVWFDDDGKWRLDTANVLLDDASRIAYDLTKAGYPYLVLKAGSDAPSHGYAPTRRRR